MDIEKLVFEQYKKFHREVNMSFVDELISSRVFIFEEINENCLFKKDIYDDCFDKIEWKTENNIKIPYVNGKKIKAIRCNDVELVCKFL